MATIFTHDNHGYVRTKHGRKGECGCIYCKTWRRDKVFSRKKLIARQTVQQLGTERELEIEIAQAI